MSISAPSRETTDVRDLDIEAITVIPGQPLTAALPLLGSSSPSLFAVDDDDAVEEDDDEDLDDDEDEDDLDEDEDE